MIFGRSPALWGALIAAGLNVLVFVFGVHMSADQVGYLNAFALVLIGIVANESDPTTAGTFAPTITRPAPTSPIMPGVPVLSSGGAAVRWDGVVVDGPPTSGTGVTNP